MHLGARCRASTRDGAAAPSLPALSLAAADAHKDQARLRHAPSTTLLKIPSRPLFVRSIILSYSRLPLLLPRRFCFSPHIFLHCPRCGLWHYGPYILDPPGPGGLFLLPEGRIRRLLQPLGFLMADSHFRLLLLPRRSPQTFRVP